MKPEEIHLYDTTRILFGDVPYEYFIEALIRILFTFTILIISLRLMGRRMAAMLDMHELSGLVALAAAIGVPLGSPDRGLLPTAIIATIVICMQRLIFSVGFKNKKIELLLHGDMSLLIEDGAINLRNLKKTLISRNRIYAQLRSFGIKNMGEVQRLYIENNGAFTLMKNDGRSPGLSIIPKYDKEFEQSEMKHIKDTCSCTICGYTQKLNEGLEKCNNCGNNDWEQAVVEINREIF